MIKNYNYTNINDERDINRSPYRNMEDKCQYCGYRQRPSSMGDMCSSCKSTNKYNSQMYKNN